VLCAHRRGPYGAATWNARVEAWLGASAGGLGDAGWYPGRPLLVTENDPVLRLSNGDTGVVVASADGRRFAAFPRGEGAVEISPTRLAAVETVYAMTIHKAQGSQFADVAVVLPDPGSRVLSRELLYTAFTRARRRLIVCGDEAALRAGLARRAVRASNLGRRLWGEPLG
jgi:exodeoxyribonuclease V alpha subunit